MLFVGPIFLVGAWTLASASLYVKSDINRVWTSTAAQANQPLSPALLVQQNNAQGQIGGPFLNSLPTLPAGWTGNGASYRYDATAAGTFALCASGDSTAANSNASATCP